MYSYISPFPFIHILRSLCDDVNCNFCSTSPNQVCHFAPKLLSAYKVVFIIKMLCGRSPNSEPTTINTFSYVVDLKQALPMSVAYVSILLGSTRNIIILSPRKDTTPKYILFTGALVVFSLATILAGCLPSCFIAQIKCTLIQICLGRCFPLPMLMSTLYSCSNSNSCSMHVYQ